MSIHRIRMTTKEKLGFVWRMAKLGQIRHARRWWKSLTMSYLIERRVPWITFSAQDYLREQIPSNARVFEFGSGGSTLFWLDHGATVVSVEHDGDWQKILRDMIPKSALLDYRYVPPTPDANARKDAKALGDPDAYVSSTEAYSGFTFKEYATQIDAFPDRHFDIVLIDGRARASCVKHGAAKVKPGGFLILDNADIEYYTEQAGKYLKDYQRTRFYGPGPSSGNMWATDFYRRQG